MQKSNGEILAMICYRWSIISTKHSTYSTLILFCLFPFWMHWKISSFCKCDSFIWYFCHSSDVWGWRGSWTSIMEDRNPRLHGHWCSLLEIVIAGRQMVCSCTFYLKQKELRYISWYISYGIIINEYSHTYHNTCVYWDDDKPWNDEQVIKVLCMRLIIMVIESWHGISLISITL